MPLIKTSLLSACFLFTMALAACDCSGDDPPGAMCASSADCAAGETCVDGLCVGSPDGGTDGGGDTGLGDSSLPDGCAAPCGTTCCVGGEVCVGGAACAPAGAACVDNDACIDDTYCDPVSMTCVPWGVPPGTESDSDCRRLVAAGVFSPTVQCRFDEAPAGDAFPANVHVLTTPMVADFLVGRGPGDPPEPSIVAVFDDGVDGSSEQPTGVIRILDGRTCMQQAELGSLQMVSHSSPPAIADLDGDGKPEIVAFKAGGGLVAFTQGAAGWEVMWRSTRADGSAYDITGSGWAGPSIYDLDDDGVPEILRGGIVFDAAGVLIDESLGLLPYSAGIFAVVADVDADGLAELVAGHGAWQWDSAGGTWTAESWSTGGTAAGHVALADLGDFPGTAAWPAETPEVAVVTSGTIRVQTLDGTIVFGPITHPGMGSGGPPTIGDFDGDGRREIASAGAAGFAIFDLDCAAAPIGACASGTTDGILWNVRSQDQSSNVTGSSVFDFEGDGRAEAVYGDECFLRVYDGETGDVLFSQSRSSCTWYENPVIADVDGDFNAEIVMGDNYNCGSATLGRDCSTFGLGPRNTDPIFPGLRCAEGADCVSGVCDAGLCRCTADAECCAGPGCTEAAIVCEVPPAGTPGTGNTCRASRPVGTLGIRVYRDAADRWVNSRRIWNQHAYHVTNVDEAGTVPRTSAAAINWTDPALNNFRQNVQGDAIAGAAPDLTSTGLPFTCDAMGGAILTANVCNRGVEPVGAGVVVG
ncbi:MAG: VCBS repeat-containing protein, partial [Deltaproteobacteria bacterium]|nr:VCBS repeat-containing protein [Deltaproteobacteria bacterium]